MPAPGTQAELLLAQESRYRRIAVSDDVRPLLVFFYTPSSGPARRMESLLAHLARKERERLRVTRVDVDQRPDLAARFGAEQGPTLVLAQDKRAVARIDGRASAPRIERMLEPYLGEIPAVV